MTEFTVEVVRGSRRTVRITWLDENGGTQSLTSWTAKADFRLGAPSASVAFSLATGNGITMDASGNIDLDFSSAVTDQRQGVYHGDVKVLPASGGNKWEFVGRIALKITDTFTT